MAISSIGGTAGSVLMEKAQSNQSKANKLEQVAVPLEDAATKQLDARDMAAAARVVMTKGALQINAAPEGSPPELTGKLDIKA